MNKEQKTLVIVPSYNAAESLVELLPEIKKYGRDILVVDDGSVDNTKAVASSFNAICIRHEKNRGKGEALQSGFRFAKENGYCNIITMDADGQHSPDNLGEFFDKKEDLIIGSREIKFGLMPFARVFSNTVTSLICSFLVGKKIRDSQSGFRKITTELLEGFKPRYRGFQFETELLLYLAGEKKCSVGHVPIMTIYGNEKSHIRHFYDTYAFVMVVIRFLFTKCRSN